MHRNSEVDEIERLWWDWRLIEDAVSRRDAAAVLYAVHALLIHTPSLLFSQQEGE